MPTPAQKKKQFVKTPEYRRSALKYSAFMLIVGLILSGILAFLIHRAENRPAPPVDSKAVDVQNPLKNKK